MRIVFAILSIAILSNCNEEKAAITQFEFYPNIPDSAGEKARFIKERIESSRRYNLAELTNGTADSIVIRVWPWEAFEPWSTMFEFRLDTNGWKGFNYCSYTFPNQDGAIVHYNGHGKLGDSVFLVKQIKPKCGWDKFYDSILFFQIRTLPTQSLIKNFDRKLILDGDAIAFEIATKNSYRGIFYSNPGSYQYKECQLIDEFTGMLIRQFGDDYYWPRNIR